MTIDEAIKHTEEVADYDCYNEKQFKCTEEHRQLAEWLKDYKRLKEQKPILDKIRAEIDGYCSDNRDRNDGLYIAMRIIDKYKESEDKE